MSIRQLNAGKNANTGAGNQAPRKDYQQQNQQQNQSGTSVEEDLRQDHETIRTATANKFGSRSNPTALLTQLAKYAKTYIAGRNRIKDYRMEVVVVEKDVGVPAVLICNVSPTEDENKVKHDAVVAHVIMLADYNIKPDSLHEFRDGNRTIYEPTVWADAMDNDYCDAIADAIHEQTDIENLILITAGVTAFNIADLPTNLLMQEHQGQDIDLDNLIFNAMTIAEAKRALEAGETDTAIRPSLLQAGNEIVADINLIPQTSKTAGGFPVAEDFRLVVKEVKANSRYDQNQPQERRSLNSKSKSKGDLTYGAVAGRIDFMYTIPRSESGYIRDPQRGDTASFIPEFIASGFDLFDRAPSLSLFVQLMASVGMLGDRDPAIFLAAFKPENVVNTPSRNLGALAAKLKDPKTGKNEKRAEFRPNTPESEFYDFAQAAILPEYRIGLEVPSQGPFVTLLEVFLHAADYANDKRIGKAANDMIIDAFDQLTDGRFSQRWDQNNDAVMEREIVMIPGGYWTDDRGHKRDSREILNYTYLANLENPKEALDMSDDYLATFNIDNPLIAANKRIELVNQVKGKNFVQTDNFNRVYFATDAYVLLLQCMLEAGTAVQTPRMNFGGVADDRRRIDTIGGRISRDALNKSYHRYDAYNGRNDNDRNNQRGRYYGSQRSYNGR